MFMCECTLVHLSVYLRRSMCEHEDKQLGNGSRHACVCVCVLVHMYVAVGRA